LSNWQAVFFCKECRREHSRSANGGWGGFVALLALAPVALAAQMITLHVDVKLVNVP
jgi:hypothetical protein